MTLTQENRMMHISTPLGVDVVLLTFFSGNEGLCVPFSFEMTLVSENSRIAFDQIIGGNVTVAIGTEEGSARFFNGLISRFSQDSGAGDSGLARYSATLVPWFWLLTKTTNSRIFQ
jgi:type VI secretion system secreted protein VgrG